MLRIKKIFIICNALLTLTAMAFADKYQIKEVNYNLTGCGISFLGVTNKYFLDRNVEVDKKRIFNSEEDFLNYYNDYLKRLNNTRAFSKIEVDYTITDDEDVKQVTFNVATTDSIHLLAVPYPKYDSNNGFNMKLKSKDSNFLGTLNSMSCDFYMQIPMAGSESTNKEFGFNFSYDYPFQAGIFQATWINDDTFSYTINDDMPEWNAKTGIELKLPFNRFSLVLDLLQYSINDNDYEDVDDNLYFKEEAQFSIPVTVAKIDNWGNLTYTPGVSVVYNWDFDGIKHSDLKGPDLSLSQTLSTGRINWDNNLRDGLSVSVSEYVGYNFYKENFVPGISAELQAFSSHNLFNTKNILNRFGICTDIYGFVNFCDIGNPDKYSSKSIGARLRGVRDEVKFDETNLKACETASAFVFSMDMPIHIFTTNFEKSFMRHLNFDFQLSPFFDVALTHNRKTNSWYYYKDGFYCGGLEALVYPLKWSSFTIRGSLGIDVGRYILSKKSGLINTGWRQGSKYEISIGLGLQY